MASIKLLIVAVVLQFTLLGRLDCSSVPARTPKKHNLITEICSDSSNPPLCFKSFNDDPRSRNADLKTLTQIAIDFSRKRAKFTLDLAYHFRKKATDKRWVTIYDICLESYANSIGYLGECTRMLKLKDYGGVLIRAHDAIIDTVTCEQGFDDQPGDKYQEPPELKDCGRNVQASCDTIVLIANKLLHQ